MSVVIANEETFSLRWTKLGHEGVGVLVALCGWSDSQLSDGDVPDEAVVLRTVPKRTLTRLLDLGELRRTPTGYAIVHFDRYCTPKATVIARREYERARKARQRSAIDPEAPPMLSGPTFSGAVPAGVPSEGGDGTTGGTPAHVPAPVPCRPEPIAIPAPAVPLATGDAVGRTAKLISENVGRKTVTVDNFGRLAKWLLDALATSDPTVPSAERAAIPVVIAWGKDPKAGGGSLWKTRAPEFRGLPADEQWRRVEAEGVECPEREEARKRERAEQKRLADEAARATQAAIDAKYEAEQRARWERERREGESYDAWKERRRAETYAYFGVKRAEQADRDVQRKAEQATKRTGSTASLGEIVGDLTAPEPGDDSDEYPGGDGEGFP